MISFFLLKEQIYAILKMIIQYVAVILICKKIFKDVKYDIIL